MVRLSGAAAGGVVLALAFAVALAAGSAAAPVRGLGTLALAAVFTGTWAGPGCPAGTPTGQECASFTGHGLVRGLGHVSETYTTAGPSDDPDVPGDDPDCDDLAFVSAVMAVAGKGEIDASLNKTSCTNAPTNVQADFTVTAGSGTYAGATGSGTVVLNITQLEGTVGGKDDRHVNGATQRSRAPVRYDRPDNQRRGREDNTCPQGGETRTRPVRGERRSSAQPPIRAPTRLQRASPSRSDPGGEVSGAGADMGTTVNNGDGTVTFTEHSAGLAIKFKIAGGGALKDANGKPILGAGTVDSVATFDIATGDVISIQKSVHGPHPRFSPRKEGAEAALVFKLGGC